VGYTRDVLANYLVDEMTAPEVVRISSGTKG
jgi:hypothetical protein